MEIQWIEELAERKLELTFSLNERKGKKKKSETLILTLGGVLMKSIGDGL